MSALLLVDNTSNLLLVDGSSSLLLAEPTVAITAPTDAGTVSTGGPNLTVSWTVDQTQASYRVRLQNAAGTTTYYDSGTIAGVTASVSIDLVAQGVPTDTTGSGLKAVVDVVVDSGLTTSDSNLFDVQWGVVTATITSPVDGAVVTDSTPDLTWTFSSTRSKAQGHYRVRVLIASSGAVYHDSAKTASASTSYTLPTLTDNTRFTVELTLYNSEGVADS